VIEKRDKSDLARMEIRSSFIKDRRAMSDTLIKIAANPSHRRWIKVSIAPAAPFNKVFTQK